ncbi:MAG: sugar phosphate nucleotidyltransferase [Bacteroidota bacterium]|nr:sugar phosphate nucleotidyltransferase [Bacteroidota bacterium]
MKIIIPMAGIGKRLRPMTLSTPKPLIQIAGKPIVEWLVNSLKKISSEKITDIGFIIGDFPIDIRPELVKIGKNMNANVHIFVQDEPLGTAHAISFASSLMNGPVIVAFADTLFDTDVKFKSNTDVVIWTKNVENPEAYGVVVKDDKDFINKFVEKPNQFVSDEAIIGIYYFQKSELLKDKLNFLLENNIVKGGEYQLTDALQMLLDDGLKFESHPISVWLDCGNKELVINTMKYVVKNFVDNSINSAGFVNCQIIEPVYIGKNVKLSNSIVGPNVTIEDNSNVERSIISNTMIFSNTHLNAVNVDNSIIGNYVKINSKSLNLALGDYNQIKI